MSRRKYDVINFDDSFSFRLKEEEKSKIKRVVKKNKDIFANPSIFIRASIIKHLREFDKGGLRK